MIIGAGPYGPALVSYTRSRSTVAREGLRTSSQLSMPRMRSTDSRHERGALVDGRSVLGHGAPPATATTRQLAAPTRLCTKNTSASTTSSSLAF